MASVVQICQMALAHCRAGTINSLTEGSSNAFFCNLFYDTCRDQVLSDAPWGFATRLTQLAKLDPESFDIFNWAYAYAYPSDCLRINRLVLNYEQVNTSSSFVTNRVYEIYDYPEANLEHPVEYEIFDIDGTTVIAANDDNLRAKYNYKATNTQKFSASFTLALSRLLASNIAVSVIGYEKGKDVMVDSLQIYRSLINNAIANDMNQRHKEPPDSEFITSRL